MSEANGKYRQRNLKKENNIFNNQLSANILITIVYIKITNSDMFRSIEDNNQGVCTLSNNI